jgi:hypothetical protein
MPRLGPFPTIVAPWRERHDLLHEARLGDVAHTGLLRCVVAGYAGSSIGLEGFQPPLGAIR